MSNATSDHLQSFSKGKKITKISPWFQEGKKKITKEKIGKFCEAFARFLFHFPHSHTFAIEYH
jgi:hypothetical protein